MGGVRRGRGSGAAGSEGAGAQQDRDAGVAHGTDDAIDTTIVVEVAAVDRAVLAVRDQVIDPRHDRVVQGRRRRQRREVECTRHGCLRAQGERVDLAVAVVVPRVHLGHEAAAAPAEHGVDAARHHAHAVRLVSGEVAAPGAIRVERRNQVGTTVIVDVRVGDVRGTCTHGREAGDRLRGIEHATRRVAEDARQELDGAIAGGGSTARPVMVSRLIGGDPMGAFQFNHGRQAEELIEAGLLRDMTHVAEAEGWKDIIFPQSLLDACTVDGKIYCAPVNIHSWQWLWLSNKAFEDAGVEVPQNWDEFVASADALRAAGKTPLALGGQSWQSSGAFNVLMVALAGPDVLVDIYGNGNAELAAGDAIARVFQAAADAREMSGGSSVQDWNLATNLVITDQAGGQIMGDWAQGEFQVAGEVAGTDYTCLPGLGVNELIDTAGDAFYFPETGNAEIEAAQDALAAVLLNPKTQVSFNLKKGSLPVRGDVDLSAANDCMKKGLEILAAGNTLPSVTQLNTEDTNNQLNDLFVEFFNDTSITPEAAQARFVTIVENKD